MEVMIRDGTEETTEGRNELIPSLVAGVVPSRLLVTTGPVLKGSEA